MSMSLSLFHASTRLVWCLGFRVSGCGFQVSGSGFRVSGFGVRVSGFVFQVTVSGSGVSGFGFWVWGLGFGVSGFGFRVTVSGSGVSGFGFRVSGFGAHQPQNPRAESRIAPSRSEGTDPRASPVLGVAVSHTAGNQGFFSTCLALRRVQRIERGVSGAEEARAACAQGSQSVALSMETPYVRTILPTGVPCS